MTDPIVQRGRRLRFGPFELDVRAGELRKYGVRLKLREQPVQILLLLLENPGEVVTRKDIRGRLWPPDTVVEFDHCINAAVKKLRSALNESADRPCYIETVSRRGYRFLGEVEVVEAVPSSVVVAVNGHGAATSALSASPSSAAPYKPRFARKAGVAGIGIAVLAAAVLWLTRPLPAPHVTRITRLTNDPHGSGAPLLTDGARLFFNLAELPDGTAGGPSEMSLSGGYPQPLVLPIPRAWISNISPDRSEFLVSQGKERGGSDLWVMPVLGGSSRRLGNLYEPQGSFVSSSYGQPVPHRLGFMLAHQSTDAWSPDGRYLVYAIDSELHLALSDGKEQWKLATVPGRPFFVRWSPDGRAIRLSVSKTDDDSTSSLWELPLENGRPAGQLRPLLPSWDPSWYTCCGDWTMDGKYYVFQSRGEIWARREKAGFLHRDSHEPVQLTHGPFAAYWPLPSLDGKRLFVAGYEARAEFLRYDPQARQFVPILPGMSGTGLSFSHDGKWVAYFSIPGGLLLRSKADGTGRVQLTPPGFKADWVSWSPDGKQIAFMGGPAGAASRIYVMPSDGGSAPRQLSHGESGPGGDTGPTWSPDGTTIAFSPTPFDAEKGAIHIMELSTGRVSALPGSAGIWAANWSPDGNWMLASSAVGWKPMLYDVRNHIQHQLTNRPLGYCSWSLDSHSLFCSDENWVCKVRIRDGHEDRLASLKGIPLTGWGWIGGGPNDSIVTARDAATQQIYALDWELP